MYLFPVACAVVGLLSSVCVQYNCHVSFFVSGYLHKEAESWWRCQLWCGLLRITRQKQSQKTLLPHRLFPRVSGCICSILTFSHWLVFLVLAKGLCLFEQINTGCCICISLSVMFTVDKVLWTVNERQSWTLRDVQESDVQVLLTNLSGSPGMKGAAPYHVLIPYCVAKLRATSKWKTLHECPFSLWLTKSCLSKE